MHRILKSLRIEHIASNYSSWKRIAYMDLPIAAASHIATSGKATGKTCIDGTWYRWEINISTLLLDR